MSIIVLTGGGTAGHVTACLALIPHLKEYFSEIHYVGSVFGIERKLVAAYKGVEYHAVSCEKFRRTFSLKNLAIPFILLRGIRETKKLFRYLSPDVVFSKGGYVSLPVVLGAGRVPVVLHESDRSLGLANRVALRHAKTVCTTFPILKKKCIHTGTPIRPELYLGDRERAILRYRIDKPVLLVLGGSQGATAVNNAVRAGIDRLCENYFVLHLCGKGKKHNNVYHTRYVQIEYEPNPADLFAAADYVLTRGGANTLCEMVALGKSMIIVPLPKSSGSRGDQIENAHFFEKEELALQLPENLLNTDSLLAALETLKKNREHFAARMTVYPADGTDNVMREILAAAGIREKRRVPSVFAKH